MQRKMWRQTIVKIHVQLEVNVKINAKKNVETIVKIHVELEAKVNMNAKKDPC